MLNLPGLRHDWAVAGWLFVLLAAASLFFFSGRFHSIDEVSSVALTDSLVTERRAHTDQITWSQGWPLPQGTFGRGGRLYSKKGIGLALVVAPLQALARVLPRVSVVGLAMLTNGWITALTGALLFGLARRLGFAASTATVVVLAWAFGTLALPYSRMLFNSPPVALAFVGATLLLVGRRVTATGNLPALLAGALLGWALLTRPENALVVPLFAAFAWATTPGAWRARGLRLVAFGLPLVLTIAWLFWFNSYRFGHPLDFGYDLSQEANGDVLVGLVGIFFSPGRSLFLYMPLLLAAFGGFASLLRARESPQRAVAWLTVGLTVVYALFFARSADWWGGWNWGIRYLLPLLPLWCLGLAPLWQRPRWRLPLVLLVALSAGIQLLGTLVDFNRPLLASETTDLPLQATLWDIRYTQIAAHLRLLPDWRRWDVVWAATGAGWLAALGALLLALALVGLARAQLGQRTMPLLLLAGAGLLLLALLTARAAYDDPAWARFHPDLEPLAARLAQAPANSVLLLEMLPYPPGAYFDRAQAWLALNRSGAPHVQLLQQPEPDSEQMALLARATRGAETILLATEGTPPGAAGSGAERWLSERAFLVGSEWLGERTRLSTFVAPRPLQPVAEGVELGDGITLARAAHNGAALRPGQPLRVELEWVTAQRPSADYKVFVHLLGPEGVVAQSDGAPQAGFAPTSSWQPGVAVTDQRALLLPSEMHPGEYALVAGLYNDSGQRLPLVVGGDSIPLGTVRVR